MSNLQPTAKMIRDVIRKHEQRKSTKYEIVLKVVELDGTSCLHPNPDGGYRKPMSSFRAYESGFKKGNFPHKEVSLWLKHSEGMNLIKLLKS